MRIMVIGAGSIGQRTNEPESSAAYKTAGRSTFYGDVSSASVTWTATARTR